MNDLGSTADMDQGERGVENAGDARAVDLVGKSMSSLHLERPGGQKESREDDTGDDSNGGWNSNSKNGWDDAGESANAWNNDSVAGGWNGWGEEFKDEDNAKDNMWTSGTSEVEVKDEWKDDGEKTNGWNNWGEEFKDEDNGNGDSWNIETSEVGDHGEADINGKVKKKNGGFRGTGGFVKLPKRLGADDCAFYMKTGTCKYGSGCKFNHPPRKKIQDMKETTKGRGESVEKQGQIECKFYLKPEGCKFGNSCKFVHANPKTSAGQSKPTLTPDADFNVLGLPIRQGAKDCPYYMRNGSCKYGSNCRFNHPEPSVEVNCEPASETNSSKSSNLSSGKIPSSSLIPTSNVPVKVSPQHDIISTSPDLNGYQFPGNSQERVFQSPEKSAENIASEPQLLPSQNTEFPERPGQPDCNHYIRTGDCKFKAHCKFHHPKNRMSKASSCALSDKGLPLRPDQNVCAFYSRYGICKFGPACKFNHPPSESEY